MSPILTFFVGVVLSTIVSSIFSETLLQGLGRLLSKIDLPSTAHIEGIWDVEFTMNENNQNIKYKETVKVVRRLGIIYGYNEPDPLNHDLLKLVEDKKPLRIRGYLIDNRFLTGTWFHPDRKSRFHGSFQLLLGLSGRKIGGVWTGYRESTNNIESGEWIWTKRI